MGSRVVIRRAHGEDAGLGGELVALALAEIVGDVNREREAQLQASRAECDGALPPEHILRALIEPIQRVSRSIDGSSLYLRIFQQIRTNPSDAFIRRVFELNGRVAEAFLEAMAEAFPETDRLDLALQIRPRGGGASARQS